MSEKANALNELFREVEALGVEVGAGVHAALGRYLEAVGVEEEDRAKRGRAHAQALERLSQRIWEAADTSDAQMAVSLYVGQVHTWESWEIPRSKLFVRADQVKKKPFKKFVILGGGAR